MHRTGKEFFGGLGRHRQLGTLTSPPPGRRPGVAVPALPVPRHRARSPCSQPFRVGPVLASEARGGRLRDPRHPRNPAERRTVRGRVSFGVGGSRSMSNDTKWIIGDRLSDGNAHHGRAPAP